MRSSCSVVRSLPVESGESWFVDDRDVRSPELTLTQVFDTDTGRTTMSHAYGMAVRRPNEPLPKGEACLVCR